MNAPVPTFSLPPCPACSSLVSLDRPFWKFAHNTSAKRKRNCYSWTGCKHSDEVAVEGKFYDDPEEWSLVEDAWAERARQLFADRTEGWTKPATEGLRRALDDKAFLVGAVAELPFSPDPPAQQKRHEPNE